MTAIRLSVVVAADSYATIEPLIRALADQPGPERVELLALVPRETRLEPGDEAGVLGRFRAVEVASLDDLRGARATGFRAATGPTILLAETHCFPGEGWLDTVLDAHEEGWIAVGPGFENANPGTAMSWANFLDHYVRFAAPAQRREVGEVAGHNATFLRSAVLELDAELPDLLRDFPTLYARLRTRGGILFEPAARMRHVHMSTWRGWVAEAWAGGRANGASRSRAWPWWRRIAYAAATPPIVGIELARRLRWSRKLRRSSRLPSATLPLLAVGIALRCGGEAAGFLLGPSARGEALLARTEINRLDYLREADRRELTAPARTESRHDETTAAAGSQE